MIAMIHFRISIIGCRLNMRVMCGMFSLDVFLELDQFRVHYRQCACFIVYVHYLLAHGIRHICTRI